MALGAFGIFVNLFVYYYAMKRVPMWSVRILVLTGPPVAMIADYLLLGSPITAAGVQGLTAVLIGATLVILGGRERRLDADVVVDVRRAASSDPP